MSEEIEVPGTYQDDLVKNYDTIREQRGWSHAMMGDYIEGLDPALAAEYRKQHAGSDKAAKSEAPKARKTAAKSEA